MALSDLQVFQEQTYSTYTEVLDQQIELFNGASQGAIVLQPAAHQGDFSETAFWAKVSGGLVKRRNVYGSGAITQKSLKHLLDRSVKVAAGSYEVELAPSQFTWIQKNPEEAAAVMGQQLAIDTMADMLNTACSATVAAYKTVAAIVNDVSGGSGGAEKMSFQNQISTAGKLGDRQNSLACWIMHSKPLTDLYLQQVNNNERLFVFGNLLVLRDPQGRVFIQTDSPGLMSAGTPNKYNTLGLQAGSIVVGQNNDFDQNFDTKNGDENIQRTYQAEWTYQLGINGFAWDATNGGKSPNDAALFTGTNWDRYATSIKDIGGVLLITQ